MKLATLGWAILLIVASTGCAKKEDTPGNPALDAPAPSPSVVWTNFSYAGTGSGSVCIGPLPCPATSDGEHTGYTVPMPPGHKPLRLTGTVSWEETPPGAEKYLAHLMCETEDGAWGRCTDDPRQFATQGGNPLKFEWDLSPVNATRVLGIAVGTRFGEDAGPTGVSYDDAGSFTVEASLVTEP